MALQLANPGVVDKVERLAAATGLTKTRAVEQAVDLMLARRVGDVRSRMEAILRQIDALPDVPGASDPLQWDDQGLPA
ncbi:MAG: type II toxin-antitoxin system VapB family antitoxin [Propionibacteriaceae bacterium]|nr:type II toxin-antitoxin system VapB family antitoxin [Propionibacteriaceae bacterium]